MRRIWLIMFGDSVSFLLAFIILIFIRFNSENYLWAINTHTKPFIILYIIWVLIFYIFGLYDLVNIKPTIPYLKRWFFAIIISFIIGLLMFYILPIFGISPKINLFIQVGLFGLFSFILRRIIYNLFSKTITKKTILIGTGGHIIKLKDTISGNPQIGLQIISHIDKIEDLKINNTDKSKILLIINNKKDINDQTIIELVKNNIEIIDTEEAYEKHLLKIPVDYINASFVTENINGYKDTVYKIISFILDKSFAIFILIITSPFLLIAIIARLIEDGKPIFIKQKRVGLNGKIFDLYKVRSMVVLSPDGSAETGKAVWATGKDDPRITKVGKIIRRLHIDEIPQMINILKGDIALVGPRPERPEFVKELPKSIPHYELRHIIRPGFTGWAQIKYKYTNTIDESKEKFEYDLYYIKNKNIFLDIGIILRTIIIIFTH